MIKLFQVYYVFGTQANTKTYMLARPHPPIYHTNAISHHVLSKAYANTGDNKILNTSKPIHTVSSTLLPPAVRLDGRMYNRNTL